MTSARELADHILKYVDPVVNMNYADRMSVLQELKVLVDREINRTAALDPQRNR